MKRHCGDLPFGPAPAAHYGARPGAYHDNGEWQPGNEGLELREVERAILDGGEDGFVEVFTRRGTDEILGATIVARHAGEMIREITAAMASVIHPYPTQAEGA